MNLTAPQSPQPQFKVQSSEFKVQSSPFADRLVPLSDGRSGRRGTMSVDVREPSLSYAGGEGQGEEAVSSDTLDFISSDETLDRCDEIIVASGWKLASYHRNPVFQNAHQYGDIIFTLGRALITEVRAGKLFQRVQFATDVNPMAKIAYGLYRGKFLNAVSVGFIPIRWEDPQAQSFSSSSSSSSSIPCRRYLEQELLEVSAVAIPANPNALALGLKSGAVEKSDLRDLADLIRCTIDPRTAAAECSADAALDTPKSVPPDYVRLINLAAQLRDVLKHT